MWIETEFCTAYNMERYSKITFSAITKVIYLVEEGREAVALYIGESHEQAKGVYDWIMQCLNKERSVCRILDAPVLQNIPEERVTTWRMQ
jgi:hypothetical protein